MGGVALLAVLLAACGSNAASTSSSGTSGTSAVSGATDTPAAAAATDTTSAITGTTSVTGTAVVTGTSEAAITGTQTVSSSTASATEAMTATTAVTGTSAVTATSAVAATSAVTSAMPSSTSGLTYTLMTTPTSLGNILVAGINGMTVYTYTKDTPNSNASACTGACLTAWPPVTVTLGTSPTLSPDVTGSVDVFTRTDTSDVQVTFNGWPVYFFSKDKAPGDTNGQNVANSWYAVVITPTTGTGTSSGAGYTSTITATGTVTSTQ